MMRKLLIILVMFAGMKTFGQYRNPVLPGFHPDPSVCRVDSDFYMVCSSFQYFPGVPIFHSRDLVNWKQIGNVLDRPSQLPLGNATSWTGIYAPTIRYYRGVYYMVTTNVGFHQRSEDGYKDSENFFVTATHPAGPWSKPIWLKQGGIDPSFFFENGHCYMTSTQDNTIMMCEIDVKSGKQLRASRPLWQGTGGRYPEGPHLYKKDGMYYLLISEGGTELAHSLTIARSRRIEGPYEPCPDNPILTQCSVKGQYKQIQGTGHGDFVQTLDGNWWLVCLGFRHFNGAHHHMGRETCLAPVRWEKNSWPVINDRQPLDTLMKGSPYGYVQGSQKVQVKRRYEFDDSALGPEWIYIQNPDLSNYQIEYSRLRLYGSFSQLWENDQPTFVGIRQEHERFVLTTKISRFDMEPGDESGLAVYQSHDGNVQLCLSTYQGDCQLKVRCQLKNLRTMLAARSVKIDNEVWLRISSDGKKYDFYYSIDGKKYRWLESIDCSLLSSETIGGFTGAVLGLYGFMGSGKHHSGYSFVDYDYLEYEGQ